MNKSATEKGNRRFNREDQNLSPPPTPPPTAADKEKAFYNRNGFHDYASYGSHECAETG